MLGSNESTAFLGRAMSLMIGQSLLGLVNNFSCFRVRDDFRIPIANPVDDSAQLHPSPRLSVQVVTDYVLNEWFAAPSVLCFQRDLTAQRDLVTYRHFEMASCGAASRTRPPILGLRVRILIQHLATPATENLDRVSWHNHDRCCLTARA